MIYSLISRIKEIIYIYIYILYNILFSDSKNSIINFKSHWIQLGVHSICNAELVRSLKFLNYDKISNLLTGRFWFTCQKWITCFSIQAANKLQQPAARSSSISFRSHTSSFSEENDRCRCTPLTSSFYFSVLGYVTNTMTCKDLNTQV